MDQKVHEFLAELASDSPAPGGGSVAALCGALGAGLVAMVCRLTVEKPKYADVRDQLLEVLDEAESLGKQFAQLVEQDTEAFQEVMAAYRMPKETEEQKGERSSAIQLATRGATEVPLKVHRLAARLMEIARMAAEKGNVNSVSDAGVAAEMAMAAAHGAALNVLINVGGLKDEVYVADVKRKLSITDHETGQLYATLSKMVEERVS